MDKQVVTVDIEAFKADTGLEDSIVKELYGVFLKELCEEKDELLTNLGRQDYDKLARVIHNIKGISGSYMLSGIAEFSKNLDTKLKEKSFEDIENGILKLTELISLAETEIRRYIGI
jgi:HPt (histidine-containing phosphotransfer) domain-containing protein